MKRLWYSQALPLIVLTLSLNLIACDRNQGSAKISLQIPSQAELNKLAGSSTGLAKVSAQGADGGSFGQATPSSISGFNCYALFVGGPSPEMSNKACAKGAEGSFEKFTFGKALGFVKPESTFEVELDANPGVRFYIIGLYSATGSCPDLKAGDMDSTSLSRPLVLGSTKVDLAPGNVSIELPFSLAADPDEQMIQGCSFMGTGGKPTSIDVHGAISSFDQSTSKLGYGTCNRLRIQPRVDSGDLLLEEDVKLSLQVNSTSGTLGQFYSDISCATPMTAATLPRGKRTVDVFFKASNSAATGDITIAGTFSGTPISKQISTQVMTGSTGTQFRFFESRLNLSAGSCAELNYFVQDSNGVSATLPATSLVASKLDGSSLSGVNYEFRASCNGSSLGNTTVASVDSIYFYLGSAVKDIMLTLGGQELSFVNVQPVASKLQVLATNATPYASDCTALNIQARDGAGGPADMTGTDAQGLLKRILGHLNFNSPAVQKFSNQYCNSSSPAHRFQITGPSSNVNEYVRFNSENSVSFGVWGGPFLSDDRESSSVSITPKWDPGLLSNAMTFFAKVSTSNYYGMDNQNTMAGSSWVWGGGGGSNHIPSALGTDSVLEIPQGSGMGANTFPYSTSFSYGFLLKFSDVTPGSPGSHFIASIANDGGGGYFYGSLSFSASAGQLVLTDRVSGGDQTVFMNVNANQWYSVVVIHDPASTMCKMYLNGVGSGIIPCDSTHPMFSYNINQLPAGSLFVAEHFILNRALTLSEVNTYNSYLKTRYPAAGLP